jgi:hypothetical protein
VQQAPGLPCALYLEEGQTKMQTSGAMRREIVASYSAVIPATGARRRRDPVAGMTVVCASRISRYSERSEAIHVAA